MKITTAEPRSEPPRRTRRRLLRRLVVVGLVVGGSLGLYLAGLASYGRMEGLFRNYGYYSNRDKGGGLTRKIKQQLRSALENLEQSSRSHELPVLRLDMKHKHFLKLAEKRAEALEYGALISEDDDEVPASIRFEGRTIRVKTRLKGDEVVHLQDDDWSLRVKVRDGDEILGRRVFSLQHPRVRGYHWDALFLDQVRRMGVLGVRHEYVQLYFNGDSRGVTDLEEHFSKELLEAQGRREGIMLALEDQSRWQWRQSGGNWIALPDHYPLARTFRPTKVGESPVLQEMDGVAKGLLRGFFDGRLRASEVFDPVTWGRMLAAVEVWDFTHLLRDHNYRFYYNPVHGHIEPIAYDTTLTIVPPSEPLLRSVEHWFTRKLLEDDVIRREFLIALKDLCKQAKSRDYLDFVRGEDQRYRSYLSGDYPLVTPFPVETLKARAEELERVTMDNYSDLLEVDAPFPEPLLALLCEDRDGRRYLELVNQAPGPIRLEELLAADSLGNLTETPGAFADLPDSLPGLDHPSMRTPISIPLDRYVLDPTGRRFVLRGVDLGNESEFEVEVRPYEAAAERPVLQPVDFDELQRRLPFAVFDDGARELVVPPGEWTVGGQTVLPEGLGLRVRAGATLRFLDDSHLIVRGPCNVGEPGGAPVHLGAAPAARGWQGIAVLRSGSACQWHNVTVGDTTGVHLRGLPLTGAITFYQTEVHLRGCTFDGTQAEDALNLIECEFSFADVGFSNTRSDAFDSDFSTGRIHGGVLEEVGGDGIDFSGSTVEVSGTVFRRIRDKAVSVGEASTLDVHDITVSDSGTAAVAKDGSSLKLRDSRFDGIQHIAVMAYVKKPEFGPGRVECQNVTVTGAARDFLAQTGSRVLVQGVEQPPEEVDIDALYQTGYMKK